MNQNKKQMIEKKKIELIVPKKEYKKKNYKTKKNERCTETKNNS